jgi:hypothetical protein
MSEPLLSLEEVNAKALAWYRKMAAMRGYILRPLLEAGAAADTIRRWTKVLSMEKKRALHIYTCWSEPFYIKVDKKRNPWAR